ncbi:MAG: hypothetical protein LBR06_08605 [Bacteroidales bacterium]|nr:hypothetical protein [Bacteroidales bacterium]
MTERLNIHTKYWLRFILVAGVFLSMIVCNLLISESDDNAAQKTEEARTCRNHALCNPVNDWKMSMRGAGMFLRLIFTAAREDCLRRYHSEQGLDMLRNAQIGASGSVLAELHFMRFNQCHTTAPPDAMSPTALLNAASQSAIPSASESLQEY